MSGSSAPSRGPIDPHDGETWWSRLTTLGWIVVSIGVAACVAIAILAVAVIVNGEEGVAIALAAVPIALAFSALVWPSSRLRGSPEVAPAWPEPPTEDVGGDEGGTLGQLLDVARDQAKIEDGRKEALSARAGFLLGFSGVILALVASEAKNVFEDAASLGSVGRPLGTWFLYAGAVMTAVAAVCALRALLSGSGGVRITAKELAGFLSPSLYGDSLGNVRYAQLKVLIEQIVADRSSNARGQDWIKAGFIALVCAILLLLVHVGVYLERTVDSPCSRAAASGVEVGRRAAPSSSKSVARTTGLAVALSPPVESSRVSDSPLAKASGDESDVGDARPPPCFGTEKY